MSLWIQGTFWLATGIGWAFFMLGAAFGHLRDTLVHGNFAPFNFWMIFVNGFVGLYLLALLYFYFKDKKISRQSR